jgi:hypothetical protein
MIEALFDRLVYRVGFDSMIKKSTGIYLTKFEKQRIKKSGGRFFY